MTRPPPRYVALGSSMASGPGISPRAPGSPRAAMRSARNYPHLLASHLGLQPGPRFVDVSATGATTGHVLREAHHGAPPQVEALDGTETLVTITIGGNDVGYVPGLLVATLPTPVRWLPVVGPRLRHALDPTARQVALAGLGASLEEVGRTIRARSPQARVVFVDYLTLLPPVGTSAFPLRERYVDDGRRIAAQLEAITAEAVTAAGCELVAAGAASREHHGWSTEPWTAGAALPLPGRPLAYHPNATGMRVVADLLIDHLGL